MMAPTGLIVAENTLTLVPCKSQFNSIFRKKDGQLVVADPTVKLAEGMNLQIIGSGYLHALDGSTAHHTEFSGDFLYKADQLDAFNQLIHFDRAKTQFWTPWFANIVMMLLITHLDILDAFDLI